MWILMVLIASISTGTLISCPHNCEDCWSPNGYARCKNGYYLNEFQKYIPCQQNCETCTCIHCRNGYFQTGNQCEPCPDNCRSCSSSTSCTLCVAGHFGKHCQPCRNCKDDLCSQSGQCMHGCKEVSYVSISGCERCPFDCLTCTSPTVCTSCNHGYYGTQCEAPCRNCKDDVCSQSGQCMHGCKDRSYVSISGCERCPYDCLTCTSPTVCTSCNHGYYGTQCEAPCRNCKNNRCSIEGQCTDGCIDRHYQGKTGCDPCPENCSRCESSSVCDLCKPGFHGTSCQQRCRHNCITCTSDRNCSNCKGGYFGHVCEHECSAICRDGCNKLDGECSGCVDGYYKEGKQCKICSNGCARCGNFNACNDCQRGYFLEQVSCIACGPNCNVCNTKDYCTACNEGHVNVNRQCLPCHNCEDFKICSSQSTCPHCINGFWGQYCGDKCNDTCKICNKTTGECTECTDNTFGPYCELKCSSNCLQSSGNISSCWQHNGTCTDGCMQGFTGTDCTEEIPTQASANFTLIVGSILGGVVLMVAVVIVRLLMWRRHVDRLDLKAGGGQPSWALVSCAVNETFNPVYDDIDIGPASESGHHTTPAGINVTSVDNVNAVAEKKYVWTGHPDKTRCEDDGADNVYDVASIRPSQWGAMSTYRSWSLAVEDTYSHINHTSCLRQHSNDNEGIYDHVTRQNIQKCVVDDTYDVAGGLTSRKSI